MTSRSRVWRRAASLVCSFVAALCGAMPALAQGAAATGGKPVVTITTSLGAIEVELDSDKAPITAKNFLEYVDAGFFDGTVFHRVIPDFMIQGGGFTPAFDQKKTREPIKNEAENGLANTRGTIAMARTNVVDSATAQFFINLKDNAFLNHSGPGQAFGYAVFGHVTKGMDVVDKIAAGPTTSKNGMQDVPKTDVVIQSIKRKKK